jgi:hypothetical protein
MNKFKHLHGHQNYNPFKYLGNIVQNVTFCWKKSVFLGSLVLQSKPILKRWIKEYKYDDVNQLQISYSKPHTFCLLGNMETIRSVYKLCFKTLITVYWKHILSKNIYFYWKHSCCFGNNIENYVSKQNFQFTSSIAISCFSGVDCSDKILIKTPFIFLSPKKKKEKSDCVSEGKLYVVCLTIVIIRLMLSVWHSLH